jgi:uncharacterized protein (DUF1778 family)
MPGSTTKSKTASQRIDLRIDAENKALFLRAARLTGTNLSAFIIDSVRERSLSLLHEHEHFVLTNRARKQFLAALTHPPKPGSSLKKAINQASKVIDEKK